MATLSEQIVGPSAVEPHEEANGYLFWGLTALFIAVPELAAALSHWMRREIPWPTISNLVGKDLERQHHAVALVVVGLIVLVALHTLASPAENKKLGQPAGGASGKPSVGGWRLGPYYSGATILLATAAGLIGWEAGASKNRLGYAIYLTLVAMGIVIPSLFRRWRQEVLAIPTLFASIALLQKRKHCHWVATLLVTLLVVLCFHLALYPWPNYAYGTP